MISEKKLIWKSRKCCFIIEPCAASTFTQHCTVAQLLIFTSSSIKPSNSTSSSSSFQPNLVESPDSTIRTDVPIIQPFVLMLLTCLIRSYLTRTGCISPIHKTWLQDPRLSFTSLKSIFCCTTWICWWSSTKRKLAFIKLQALTLMKCLVLWWNQLLSE